MPYNISKDYIHPTIDEELGWRSASSASSNYEDALENWKNRMHEVSFRKCGLITQSLRHVMTEIIELLVYEGLPELSMFLMEFEEKVSEPQQFLALEEALKATQARSWETQQNTITGWAQCRRLMTILFGNTEAYHAGRYDGRNDPSNHLMECQTLWAS